MEEAKNQKTPESKQPKTHRLITQIPENKIPEFPSPKPIRHHRPPSGPQPHTLSPATRGREKDVSDTITVSTPPKTSQRWQKVRFEQWCAIQMVVGAIRRWDSGYGCDSTSSFCVCTSGCSWVVVLGGHGSLLCFGCGFLFWGLQFGFCFLVVFFFFDFLLTKNMATMAASPPQFGILQLFSCPIWVFHHSWSKY